MNQSHYKNVATKAAPACRGFRIERCTRDQFASRGSATPLRTIYSKTGVISDHYPITRRSFAIVGAACALTCLAAPAIASSSEASSDTPPATLKPWDGGGKPAFALDDLRGDQRNLQAFAGKAVLVHFFATWCEPCVREIDSLQRLAAATRDKPLAIIAVDVAEVDLRVRAFFEKHPVDFTVLLDRDRAVSKAWDVSALPTSFVLDATLTPRLFIEGDLDWASPGAMAAIEAFYPTTGRDNRPLSKQPDRS
jgi:thiol-disulfide isomerase/thioredoxin